MSTTEEIIAQLERDRAAAPTAAAVAACDQQIAAHRQLADLYAEGLGYVERGADDKAAAVGGRMSELARLVHQLPTFPEPEAAPAAGGSSTGQSKPAGRAREAT